MTTTLIVPGLNASGSAHWQTWLETRVPNAVRVVQSDWKRANLPEWAGRVRRDIARNPGPIVIAAHSFGALAAVQAADDLSDRIVGALLVAPADPDKFAVSDTLPAGPLAFPVTLVASRNDPWLRFERAVELAARWGADLVDLGAAGHINAEAGYGPWPFALRLLQQLGSAAAASAARTGASAFPKERIGDVRLHAQRLSEFDDFAAAHRRSAQAHDAPRCAKATREELLQSRHAGGLRFT